MIRPVTHLQSGAIPFRRNGEGIEVLLVTSRRRGRWTVPKGLIEPGLTPEASAAKEAWEEAGVRGFVLRPSLGFWHYEKWGGTYRVEIFPLEVGEVLQRWPEDDRRRRWLSAASAASVVRAPDLAGLLHALPERLGRAPSER